MGVTIRADGGDEEVCGVDRKEQGHQASTGIYTLVGGVRRVSRRACAATGSANRCDPPRRTGRLPCHGAACARKRRNRHHRHRQGFATVKNPPARKIPSASTGRVRRGSTTRDHTGYTSTNSVRKQGSRVRTRRSIRPGGLVRSARCGPHRLSSTWMAVNHFVRLLGEPRTAGCPVPTSSGDWRRDMTVTRTDGGRYSRQRPTDARSHLNDTAFGPLAVSVEPIFAADAVTSEKAANFRGLRATSPCADQVTRRTSRTHLRFHA